MLESGVWMLLLAVIAPAALGLATLLLPRSSTSARPLVALIGPVISFAILAWMSATVGVGAPTGSIPLVSDLGIALDFRADALGTFFGMLVSGIGCLIVVYARGYFGPDAASLGRFYPTLGFFATAMMGLVLADNIVLMFMFWELTSISSFLLIGWHRDDEKSVRLAMQAFATTGLGGMVLLAGVLMLGSITGVWSFSELIPALEAGRGGALVPWAFALLFIGGAAKSAQWPLHFWLPGAMAAPTPVSAYLHSATMVKAGVYLFGRLQPAMGDLAAWGPTLTIFGAITMALGGVLALRSSELKKIFAYSTVSQLGLFTCGYGLAHFGAHHGEANLSWPVTQILNHALYKAPLFMIAGAITHAVGKKNLGDLKGLWRTHPVLVIICLIGLAGLMALPGTLSFGAKEAFLHQVIHAAEAHPMIWLVAAATILAAVCNTAIAIRFARTFFAAPAPDAHGEHNDHHAHESGLWGACIWAPAALLAVWQIIGGIAPGFLESIIKPVETNFAGFDHLPSVWHAIAHPNLALALSGVSLVFGIALGFSAIGATPVVDPHNALFPATYRGLERLGRTIVTTLQSGNLRTYLGVVFVAMLAGLGLAAYADPSFLRLPALVTMGNATFMVVVAAVCLTVLICATALILPMVKSRVLRVLVLGSCGFSVVGMYLIYQAPDLALTQLMFELISVVLFLLVLRLLPEEDAETPDAWRRGRVALSAVVGIAIGWTTLHAGTTADLFHVEQRQHQLAQIEAGAHEASIVPIAAGGAHGAVTTPKDFQPTGRLGDWFAAHAYEGSVSSDGRGAGGNNIVNVILVDFRGYDTMGEITVLAIALIGVLAMLAATPAARSRLARGALFVGSGSAPVGGQPHLRSSLLRTAMGLILPLSLAYAGYVFFKGHNEPGGGFIAGLIAAVGFAVYRMSEGGEALRRLIPIHPGVLAAIGLAVALTTGFLPVIIGAVAYDGPFPLFYSGQFHIPRIGADPFHLPSVAFFDFGVFLVVVGVSVGMLNRFEEELES